MRPILLAAVLLASACTSAQVSRTVADGQLFCAVGQSVVAIQQVTGPVIVTGQTAAYVQAACALVNGIAVSPPASPGTVGTVTIPAVTVPLKG